MIYVNVDATRAGVPYSFKNVQVESIAALKQQYGAAGFEVSGYTVINPPRPDVVGDPKITTTGSTTTPSKKGVLIVGLLVLWWLWS